MRARPARNPDLHGNVPDDASSALLLIDADCVAAIDPEESRAALRHMARVLKADTRPSSELDLAALAARPHAA